MAERLKLYYQNIVVPKLVEQFKYTNRLQAPKIEKVVINRGIGDGSQNGKVVDSCLKEVALMTGQRGVITRSKKSIAAFKLREKSPVGVSVTLRGERMYGFLDRLINLALPRIRDFQGVSSKKFDGCGNYSLGLEEQLMFPEIEYDKVEQIRGMDISIVTSAKSNDEGVALLTWLGMPFKVA